MADPRITQRTASSLTAHTGKWRRWEHYLQTFSAVSTLHMPRPGLHSPPEAALTCQWRDTCSPQCCAALSAKGPWWLAIRFGVYFQLWRGKEFIKNASCPLPCASLQQWLKNGGTREECWQRQCPRKNSCLHYSLDSGSAEDLEFVSESGPIIVCEHEAASDDAATMMTRPVVPRRQHTNNENRPLSPWTVHSNQKIFKRHISEVWETQKKREKFGAVFYKY